MSAFEESLQAYQAVDPIFAHLVLSVSTCFAGTQVGVLRIYRNSDPQRNRQLYETAVQFGVNIGISAEENLRMIATGVWRTDGRTGLKGGMAHGANSVRLGNIGVVF